jgi:pimeloyl-ACP methyl ester carboxylesterase
MAADLAIALYPEGTEQVEVSVGDGQFLRGLFVSAGEGAPVVLHLLESSGSVASLGYHYEVLGRQLQGLGFSSLLVDYSGVGASDGERSPDQLARDAQAMWRYALARAGGDPDRVVVRGISIGTVATALLLRGGAEPGAVILHAPVLPDTCVRRFADHQYGFFMAWMAAALYADVADVDLPAEVAACEAPLLVLAGTRDFFLSDEERALVTDAVHSAGGRLTSPASGHARATVEAHALVKEELELLVETLPPKPLTSSELDALVASIRERVGDEAAAAVGTPQGRERLAELARHARTANPVLLAAVSLANAPGLDAVRWLWMLDERGKLQELPFDELVDAVALDGLPMDIIAETALGPDVSHRFGGASFSEGVGLMLHRVAVALEQAEPLAIGGSRLLMGDRTVLDSDQRSQNGAIVITIDVGWDQAEIVADPVELIDRLVQAGVPEEELARAAVRTLLKGRRIPERLVIAPDGSRRLQIHEQGVWRELDLHPGSEPISWSTAIPQPLGRRATKLIEAWKAEYEAAGIEPGGGC